jgi:ketosteroid isomerase-like protein
VSIDYASGGELLQAFCRALSTFDGEAWSDLFTEDVEYRPDPFSAPLVGRNAVRSYLLETSRDGDHVEITIERHWVVPPSVLAAFHASYVRTADRARVRVSGFLVAEVADDGRIDRYREWTERRETPATE